MKTQKKGRILRVLFCLLLTAAVLIGRIAQWVMEQASLNLDEILFTLTHPVDGTDAGFYWSIIRFSVIPALAILFVVLTLQTFLDH